MWGTIRFFLYYYGGVRHHSWWGKALLVLHVRINGTSQYCNIIYALCFFTQLLFPILDLTLMLNASSCFCCCCATFQWKCWLKLGQFLWPRIEGMQYYSNSKTISNNKFIFYYLGKIEVTFYRLFQCFPYLICSLGSWGQQPRICQLLVVLPFH